MGFSFPLPIHYYFRADAPNCTVVEYVANLLQPLSRIVGQTQMQMQTVYQVCSFKNALYIYHKAAFKWQVSFSATSSQSVVQPEIHPSLRIAWFCSSFISFLKNYKSVSFRANPILLNFILFAESKLLIT